LINLALQFLRDGVDDPRLNRELLELFPHRFDSCAEFKRLFVYDCSVSQTEIAAGLDDDYNHRCYTTLRQAIMEPYDEKNSRSLVTSADELP
jgi:hypothetical protein